METKLPITRKIVPIKPPCPGGQEFALLNAANVAFVVVVVVTDVVLVVVVVELTVEVEEVVVVVVVVQTESGVGRERLPKRGEYPRLLRELSTFRSEALYSNNPLYSTFLGEPVKNFQRTPLARAPPNI